MPNSNLDRDAAFMPTKLEQHNNNVRDLLAKVRSYIDAGDIQKAEMYADAAQMMIDLFNQQTSAVTKF